MLSALSFRQKFAMLKRLSIVVMMYNRTNGIKRQTNAIQLHLKKIFKVCVWTLERVVALTTRMHSSRMRTGRTLTVFRWRAPPPPKKRHPPRKFGGTTPPKKTPPRKFGGTPPSPGKIRAKSRAPPPPRGQTHACENITLVKISSF